jgi:hypothetical protein
MADGQCGADAQAAAGDNDVIIAKFKGRLTGNLRLDQH